MKLYQNYADGMTYYLGIDKKRKVFCVDSEKGRHNRIGYITVDETGYREAFSPVLIQTLEYKAIPWNF